MKKIAVLLFCLVLMLTVAACTNNETGNKSKTESGNDANSQNNETSEPVTLKFYSWYQYEGDHFNKMIDAFEQEYTDIHIEFTSLSENSDSNEYLKKLDLAASTNEAMDVIMFPSASEYAQRVNAGLVAPLDEFIAQEGFDFDNEYKFNTQLNEKYYALPGKYIDWMVLINKSHLDEVGLAVPTEWTWDQYLEYAKAMTKGEGASKRYGTYFHSWGDYFQLAQLNAKGDNGLISSDGSANIDNPRIRKSLEIVHQAQNVEKTAIPYAEVISQKMGYRDVFFGEKASMIVIGNWMIPETAGNENYTANFETVFAPYPKFEEDDVNGLTSAGGDFVSIAAKSKHKEEAYTFIRWLSTKGLSNSGKFISAWKQADPDTMIQSIVSQGKNPKMVNTKSLTDVMNISKGAGLIGLNSYYGEAVNTYVAEAELFILGEQSLEKTVKEAHQKVQDIIDSNQ